MFYILINLDSAVNFQIKENFTSCLSPLFPKFVHVCLCVFLHIYVGMSECMYTTAMFLLRSTEVIKELVWSLLVQIRLKLLCLSRSFLYLDHILFLFPKMHLLPSNVVLFCSFKHA